MKPIPLDHDTLLCHPSQLERMCEVSRGLLDVQPCSYLEPDQIVTMNRASLMPKFELGLPELPDPTPAQKEPVRETRVVMRAIFPDKVKWRRDRWALAKLLDPKWRHPKAKKVK